MMKKLIFTLFASIFTILGYAQTWNLEGAAQFSQNASDLAIAHHPISGETYVAYANTIDASKVYVMKYNGSSWVAVGAGAASTVGASMLSIAFNPVTNEPWVCYKNDFNGKLDVLKYSASTWTAVGLSIDTDANSAVVKNKTQLRFSPTGAAFICHNYEEVASFYKLRIVSNQTGSWATEFTSYSYVRPNSFDFVAYDRVYYTVPYASSQSTYIVKITYNGSTWSLPTLNTSLANNISSNFAADETDYWVMRRQTNNLVHYNGTVGSAAPANTTSIEATYLYYDKNPKDGQKYLMYADNAGAIKAQKYDSGSNTWDTLAPTGISFGAATERDFAMTIHPLNGYVYVAYSDNGKISVKTYEVNTPPVNFFVDKDAVGNNDGTSWADAFTDLSAGLVAANTAALTKEVWVAEGTYKPHASSRTIRFNVGAEVKLYGGFNGTETTKGERNWKQNRVVLSGDLQGNDNANLSFTEATRSDNSYNVILISGEDTRIDGVTITGGQANHASSAGYNRGAAIYKSGAVQNIELHNCIIENNVANLAAGLFAEVTTAGTRTINIDKCTFRNNLSRYGTAFLISTTAAGTGTAVISNSLMHNNTAMDLPSGQGFAGSAGYWDTRSGTTLNVSLINCTIADNTDSGTQSTLKETSPIAARRYAGTLNFTATNNIFVGNNGVQSFGRLNSNNCPTSVTLKNNLRPDAATTWCGGSSTQEATTAPTLTTDYRLIATSAGIDIGDNTSAVGTMDYDGTDRIVNTTIDCGAFEYDVCNIIIGQPTNATICLGTDTSFQIAATGTGLTYQWQKDGVDIINATSTFLQVTNVQAVDLGDYTVIISGGSCGADTSYIALLDQNKKKPTISQQPTDLTGCFSDNYTIEVVASGTNLTYQWQKDGVDIIGATNTSYFFNGIAHADTGSYSVMIEGAGVCPIMSDTIMVNVNTAPFITQQPVAQSACEGEDINLSVVATGGGLVYAWFKAGVGGLPGDTSAITLNNLTSSNQGTYGVEIFGTCGYVLSNQVLLTVNSPTTGTDVQTTCGPFTWIDGNTYVSDNSTAKDTLIGGNSNGCDSIVTLDLTITGIDTTTSLAGNTISATQTAATYQWVDCNNGNAPIVGATNASYTPIANGDYAVEITLNGCTKTSDCVNVVLSSVNAISKANNVIRVYPNPTKDELTLGVDDYIEELRIVDSKGQLVKAVKGVQNTVDVSELSNGMYLIQIQTQHAVQTARFVKK